MIITHVYVQQSNGKMVAIIIALYPGTIPSFWSLKREGLDHFIT